MKYLKNTSIQYHIPDSNQLLNFFQPGISNYLLLNADEFEQTTALSFLEKIMVSVHLKDGDNALIVPVSKDQYISLSNMESGQIVQLIFFGMQDDQIQFQGEKPMHHLIELKSLRLLFAKTLASYSIDAEKKALWAALKNMYLKDPPSI